LFEIKLGLYLEPALLVNTLSTKRNILLLNIYFVSKNGCEISWTWTA